MTDFLKLLDSLPEEKRKVLQEMFLNAPYWLLKELRVRNIPRSTEFITEGEPAKKIYILIDGKVKAADLHRYEVVYDYTVFEAIHVFGAMEFYMGYENYVTTLITTTACRMLEVSKEYYVRWLMNDSDMQLKQVQSMLRSLNDQSQKERIFIFLNGTQRMYYLFAKMYKKYSTDGQLTIRNTKEDLANMAGTDVRTVNRAIRKMAEDGLLTKQGRSLLVTRHQFEEMSRILQKMIYKNGGIPDGKEKDNFGL